MNDIIRCENLRLQLKKLDRYRDWKSMRNQIADATGDVGIFPEGI